MNDCKITHIIFSKTTLFVRSLCLVLLFSLSSLNAQVKATIDSTTVKIGEEVKLIMNMETDTTSVVIFPDVKNMGALEVIESYPVDTTFNQAKMTLIKKYGLTQFDSGHYTVPSQKIIVNGKPVFSDSLHIEIKDVLVDTTKQKMFDIKPIILVEKPKEGFPIWVVGLLIALALIAVAIYFIFFRKTKKEKEEENKLPPFESAIEHLKALDNSDLLESEEYKKYYTQLTDVLKTYLEEDVYANALEQTSDELITKLELLKDSGELPITTEAINDLRKVLQTADLVKFAKSKPDQGTARVDRATIEQVISETKNVLPEPTEEELLRNEQYRLEQEKKKRKKKIILAIITAIVILIATTATLIGIYGYDKVRDSIFGNESKELLEDNWIRSEYGSPAIIISTPKVLKRVEAQTPNRAEEYFEYGGIDQPVYIKVGIIKIASNPLKVLQPGEEEQDEDEEKEPEIDLELVNELTLQSIEKLGATNVFVKQEKYETKDGFEGMKAYGSFNFNIEKTGTILKSRYEVITFSQEAAIQQVILIHMDGDDYGKKMVGKILDSVELKKAEE